MTAVDILIDTLIAAGVEPGTAAGMVARAGAEMGSAPSKAALRTRKWRAKKASQTVTKRHGVTVPEASEKPSPSVTNRHQTSPGDGAHISLSSSKTLREIPKKEEKEDASQRARASRLPLDWKLPAEFIDYALKKGIARERIPVLGEKFLNYWRGKPGKDGASPDWFARWRTFCLNEIEWNGGANGHRNRDDRTSQTSGHPPAGQDAILAGLGRIADRVRERGDAERRERELAQGGDAARSDDPGRL